MVHTMEYYSAFKRKKILIYTTTWMDLEDVILSEIRQSQEDGMVYNSTYLRYWVEYRDGKWNSGSQGLQWGKNEVLFDWFRVSNLKNEKVLELDGGDGCATTRMQLIHVKMVKMVKFVLLVFCHSKKKFEREANYTKLKTRLTCNFEI